jgi:3-oxoacyl-[acyl-carrier protein] reductase
MSEIAVSSRPVAIVTGGARGLGLDIVRALIAKGFDVAITGRSVAASVDTACLIKDLPAAARCVYFEHDTADCGAHAALVERVRGVFGGLNCLVNNVGVTSRVRNDVLDVQPADLDRMYEVNVRGTFFLAQAFANNLLDNAGKSGMACIINVTSIAAEVLSVGLGPYCISKAALSVATQVLALRLAKHGIPVHEVRPGFLWRAGQGRDDSSPLDDWIAGGGVPMKRRGEAQEIGTAIATLAAGELPYMTGQPIWLAGGINIRTAF